MAVFALALLVAVAIPVFSMRRMMMGPPPLTADQLSGARAGAEVGVGENIDVAIVVDAPPADGLVSGAVLDQVASGVYRRTERLLRVRYSAQTPVVMGQTGDIRDGAVLQVRGQLSSTEELVAERIVILTGAVRVQ